MIFDQFNYRILIPILNLFYFYVQNIKFAEDFIKIIWKAFSLTFHMILLPFYKIYRSLTGKYDVLENIYVPGDSIIKYEKQPNFWHHSSKFKS